MSEYVAVLMSVYIKDSKDHLERAIVSIKSQKYTKLDIYLAVDGEVEGDVQIYLNDLQQEKNIYIFYSSENRGLAFQLNRLINKVLAFPCYKYLARMDADDISDPLRIGKQVKFLQERSDVDVVGSSVLEIDDTGKVLFTKRMDVDSKALRENIIRKSPFNHPTVMFRAEFFLKHSKIRYKNTLLNTQDYYLWVDMLEVGAQFANLDEPLLKFRVGDDFYDKRGSGKALNDFKARIYAMNRLKIWSSYNILITILLLILRLSPRFVKMWAYKKLR